MGNQRSSTRPSLRVFYFRMNRAESSRANLIKAIEARKKKSWSNLSCLGCGKICEVRMASIRKGWKYCSWQCRKNNMRGSKGPNSGGGNWMKGTGNINYKHGNGYKDGRNWGLVKIWRRRVFERDQYTCVRCGFNKGKIIQAHHLKSWCNYLKDRYIVNNGITVCIKCHRWIHSKQNLKKQYIHESN